MSIHFYDDTAINLDDLKFVDGLITWPIRLTETGMLLALESYFGLIAVVGSHEEAYWQFAMQMENELSLFFLW